MGDVDAGIDNGCSAIGHGFNTDVATPNGEICCSSFQAARTAHDAIGHCKNMRAHVCTHADMFQLAKFGNPWAGSDTGWYGDHGVSNGGNWDDEVRPLARD
jgi:hypothetical protein